jgi:hypothetical protein
MGIRDIFLITYVVQSTEYGLITSHKNAEEVVGGSSTHYPLLSRRCLRRNLLTNYLVITLRLRQLRLSVAGPHVSI